jgi:transposase
MEATGYYHLRLGYFLIEYGAEVSIVNPLKIKRFIQMHLSKIKTDKSDSKMIYEYAKNCDSILWDSQSKT